jgi:hypothetical protein
MQEPATLISMPFVHHLQVREIQLSNPTRRPLAYAARLEGSSDFTLEASLVKIDPGLSTQVIVNPCSMHLVLRNSSR